MKLLIVEDDELLQNGLSKALLSQGYSCDCVSSTQEARKLYMMSEYSGVLLDLGLPVENGIYFLKEWRQQKDMIPVLIMTARDSIEDRVNGLDAGADDYLIKPFELVELFARIRAIIRRSVGQSDNSIEYDEISLDLSNRQVRKSGLIIELTNREFAILSRLMLKKGLTVSRELLQQDVYSWEDSFGSNTLEVYIHRLRSKIGKRYIHTVRGLGYRFGD
ncbi:response regulator [Neisseriaceae bacterium PsAf]|nr:response regulator [Neisseriaceae bacterium PsAf]